MLLTLYLFKNAHMNKTPVFYIACDPIYAHPLPEGHRFPMLKYELIPAQLLHEGTIDPGDLFSPALCPDDDVLTTHESDYVNRLKNQQLSTREQRHIGFPQSPELTRREFMIAQGTINCCLSALEHGVALNVAGGTHHAFYDHGEGFCMLNDQAIAANYLLRNALAERIMIIDLDVHQGNGTASLFADQPAVFTFSMHGKNNYPFRKYKSDLDIELEDGTDTATYLNLLEKNLPGLIGNFQPDFVFYLAGADILDTDRFGKLKVSVEGCALRDKFVFTLLKRANIPCEVSMGGGYSNDVRIITDAHCNTFRLARDTWNL